MNVGSPPNHYSSMLMHGGGQGITTTMVQLFFAWRVKVLTRNIPLVAVIVITSISSGCKCLVQSSGGRPKVNTVQCAQSEQLLQ